MKRRSIVGPLLLIVIGALFLMKNIHPDLPLMEIFGRYWPFLLIAWGLFRLAEIFYWAANSRPLPRSGISGGEWALVVLICIAGSVSMAATRFSWPHSRITMRGLEVFGESYDYPVSGQQPAGKAPRVVIENLRGNARVTGGDAEEVKVTGRKTIRAFDRADADKANQQSPIEVLQQGEQIVIRTNQERIGESRRASADLEITVPRGASVEARGRYGDFDINEISGGVSIDSDNAGVRLQNIGGSVRVEIRRSDIVRASLVKGPVEIRGRGNDVDLDQIDGPVTVNGSFYGELQFQKLSKPLRFESSTTDLSIERVPGQVRIGRGNLSGTNLVGPIRLTTKSRDVQLSDFTQTLELSLDRGDVELRPAKLPLAAMEVLTRSGDIELSVPPGAKFEMKAVSERGDVQNDFGAPLNLKPDGRGAILAGSVGQGPAIQLTSNRGVITVRKAGSEPAAPPLPPEAPEPPARPKPKIE
jgi:DUF4097 and DUF4098 domain-containing protein YvlB